jgi:molecular chaperone DnaK (HSP70)
VRLRAVQRALRERHGERVRLADQVDLAVCRGAARVGHDLGAGAGALFWEEGPQQGLRARASGLAVQPPAQLQNQLPRHVGVVAEDQGRRLTVPMVEQGSPLPARHERCFYTTLPEAAEICVPIAEWEPEAPGAAVSLGELRIQGLPPGLPAGSPVLVSFSLDLGGGLRISARAAGREAEAELGLGRDPAAEPGPGLVDLPIWADSLP